MYPYPIPQSSCPPLNNCNPCCGPIVISVIGTETQTYTFPTTSFSPSGSTQWQTVRLTEAIIDTESCFTPVSSIYNIPCNGFYNFQTNINFQSSSSTLQVQVAIIKNGILGTVMAMGDSIPDSNSQLISLNITDYLCANEYVGVYLRLNGIPTTTQTVTVVDLNTFSGFKIGQ
jgi:hypothetical protein